MESTETERRETHSQRLNDSKLDWEEKKMGFSPPNNRNADDQVAKNEKDEDETDRGNRKRKVESMEVDRAPKRVRDRLPSENHQTASVSSAVRQTTDKSLKGIEEIKKVLVPSHRCMPLKDNWTKISSLIDQHLKIRARFYLKERLVEIKPSKETQEIGHLQRAEDFVRAFILGCDVEEALALARLPQLYIETFELPDLKPSKIIERIETNGNRSKHSIEKASKTRILISESKIYLLGTRANIKSARNALSELILGRVNSKNLTSSVKPTIHSSVVALPKMEKQRSEALEEQKSDREGLKRNRRMFGMILGTLQRFQSEESRRKDVLVKRTQIEKKLEAAAEEEREKVKIERRKQILERREKQAQMRRDLKKAERSEIHQEWEKAHQQLGNFIQTKHKPSIFWMPKRHTPETEKRLKETKDKYRLIFAEKRAKLQKELDEIDELYKKERDADARNVAALEAQEHMEEEAPEDEHEIDLNVTNNGKTDLDQQKEHVEEMDSSEKNAVNEQSELSSSQKLDSAVEKTNNDQEFEPIYDD